MPLFFLLSGVLWHQEDELPIKKYSKRYLAPYFCFAALNYLADVLIHFRDIYDYPFGKKIIGILYSRGTTEWMPNCSPLWFLTCMFVALVLLYFIMKFQNHYIRDSLIAICAIISIIIGASEIPKLVWNIDTALMAVSFIWIGSRWKHLIFGKNWIVVIISGCIGTVSILLNPVKNVEFNDVLYGNPALMIIGALGVSFAYMSICYQIGNFEDYLSRYVRWIGKNSIFFMSFDYLSRTITTNLLGKVNAGGWLIVFISKLVLLSIGCWIWNEINIRVHKRVF